MVHHQPRAGDRRREGRLPGAARALSPPAARGWFGARPGAGRNGRARCCHIDTTRTRCGCRILRHRPARAGSPIGPNERLGRSDTAIILWRRMLERELGAMQEGAGEYHYRVDEVRPDAGGDRYRRRRCRRPDADHRQRSLRARRDYPRFKPAADYRHERHRRRRIPRRNNGRRSAVCAGRQRHNRRDRGHGP